MSTKTTETKQEAIIAEKSSAKSNWPIWVIIVALILIIAFGFLLFFSIRNLSGVSISGTIVGIYAFAIILLIIGIIGAFWS